MSQDVVQFDERNKEFVPAHEDASGMAGWLIDKDIVRTKQQAGIVLSVFAIILLIASIMVSLFAGRNTQQEVFDNLEYIDPKTL